MPHLNCTGHEGKREQNGTPRNGTSIHIHRPAGQQHSISKAQLQPKTSKRFTNTRFSLLPSRRLSTLFLLQPATNPRAENERLFRRSAVFTHNVSTGSEHGTGCSAHEHESHSPDGIFSAMLRFFWHAEAGGFNLCRLCPLDRCWRAVSLQYQQLRKV